VDGPPRFAEQLVHDLLAVAEIRELQPVKIRSACIDNASVIAARSPAPNDRSAAGASKAEPFQALHLTVGLVARVLDPHVMSLEECFHLKTCLNPKKLL
jgi:hypothetical protein